MIDREIEQEQIRQFIAKRGVKKLPTISSDEYEKPAVQVQLDDQTDEQEGEENDQ